MSYFPNAAIAVIGSAIPTVAELIGGSDGTDLRALLTDSTGQLKVLVQNSVAVTGTFWQTTQPVSAASLPLPTGASTAAKQPALGTAGSASSDVITVQGIASMTPLSVTFPSAQHVIVDSGGGGGVQYVDGTAESAGAFTGTVALSYNGTDVVGLRSDASDNLLVKVNVALPAGTNVIGHVITDSGSTTAVTGSVAVTGTFWQATQPVSIASGQVASGAFSSGSIASGAIASGAVAAGAIASGAAVSGAFADGALVTLGSKADAKSTATDTTAITIMQVLKEISYMEQNPASTPVTGTFWQTTQPVSIAAAVTVVGDAANGAAVAGNPVLVAGSDGTDARTLLASSTGQLHVIVDSGGGGGVQYTDGTSESSGAFTITVAGSYNGTGVVGLRSDASDNLLTKINVALPAGTNVIGHVITDSGSTTAVTQATAANLNATVVGTGTFATQSAITATSGAIASGAIASGAIASGALAAGSIASGAAVSGAFADGASVTLGSKADAKSTATDTTAITIMQVLKEISYMAQNPAAVVVSGVTSAEYNASTIANPSSPSAVQMQSDLNGNLKIMPGLATQTLTAWTSSNFTTGSSFSVVFAQNTGCEAVIVQLDQTGTLSTGAVTWQGTYDGTNWVTIPAQQVLDPTSSTFAQIANPYSFLTSTNKPFLIIMGGYQQVRALCSTSLTGTGSVTPYVTQVAYSPVEASGVVNIGSTNGLALDTSVNGILISQGHTLASQKGPLAQAAVYSLASPPSYTATQVSPLVVDTAGNLLVTLATSTSNSNNLNCYIAGVVGTAHFNSNAVGVVGLGVSTYADNIGINIGGDVQIPTGVNPSGSVYALQTDLTSVNGTTVVTAASGVQKVGVVGNAGAAFDAATNAAPPANAVQVGFVAATALPSAYTATDLVPGMTDKFGRQAVVLNTVRDLAGTLILSNNSSSSLTNFGSAGASGVYLDIVTFVATNRNTTTATVVSLSDGTNTYTYALAASGGIVINFPTPLPAASSTTQWKVSNSAGNACDYMAVVANNK